MSSTISTLPRRRSGRCATCGEVLQSDEPCGCERAALRREPPSVATSATDACDDLQHYACPGYLRMRAGEWHRCRCVCHGPDRLEDLSTG